MIIFTKITEVQAYVKEARLKGLSLGFVPTMGALHQGHISLIEASVKTCDLCICSIFVNPTQFNDKADLERYPRMPEADAQMLKNTGCTMLFLPSVNEMYPPGVSKEVFEFGHLDQVLEAKHRPGHFNGVAQVVKRFFEIVQPHKAFFGSKDYQQVMIVKELLRQMQSQIELIACPILREADGLAMSSRNALLNKEERITAGFIPKLMLEANQLAKNQSIEVAKEFVHKAVLEQKDCKLDYFEICNPVNLETILLQKAPPGSISLMAVYVGKIRLIDNLIL